MKYCQSKSFIPCAVLAVLLSASMLACGDTKQADTENTANEETDYQTEEITETADIAVANVPADKDFNGYTFTFLVTGNTENNWQKNDFLAENETGEVLNDARYQRNRVVEERFNITIATDEQFGGTKGSGSGFTTIQKCVMAGDTSYDAGMIAGYDCATLAYSGLLYDLNELPYLDMSQRWWDQRVAQDLTIRDQL
ncbi:MAG: hypothetical protein ACI3XM_03190, partial [Eubacteriales bacterium]